MNRQIIIIAVVFAGLFIGAGAFYTLRSSVPAPVQQGTVPTSGTTNVGSGPVITKDYSAEVQAAFRAAIAPLAKENIKLKETVVSGDYAIQVWTGDTMGGEALLKRDAQGKWNTVSGGGGAWSVAGLHDQGVPAKNVLMLLDGVRHLVR